MVRISAVPEGELVVRSDLVGRSAALAALREACVRAIDFQAPQLVTIVGNQGTGKTRLINEMIIQLRLSVDGSARVHHGAARRDTAGQPVERAALTSLLDDRFGIGPNSDDASRQRFGREIESIAPNQAAELLYFIGNVVGLAFPSMPFLLAATEDPRQRGHLERTALRRLFELDAGRSPLVIVFDDLQWADDDTLSMIDDVTATLSGAPIVVVAAARPEMLVRCATWGQNTSNHTRIDLRNLDGDDAEQMVRNLLARCAEVPDDTVQSAIELTGGNPAFLELLVSRFLANGAIDAGESVWRLDPQRASAIDLPMSVEEAIEARIAALEPEEREVLEKAAVFGNVFWLSAVVALTRLELPFEASDGQPLGPARRQGLRNVDRHQGLPDERSSSDERGRTWGDPLDIEWGNGEDVRRRVADVVHILAERDYVLLLDAEDSSMPSDVEVVFKHNLEREQIARATDPDRAARYAIAAAQWFEAKLSAPRDEQLEFLATLYERGGDAQRAARCYLQGGDRARARHCPEEARTLYERGLAMLSSAEAPERMDALHNLGDVLEQVGKTQEASEHFVEMLRLAWRYDNLGKAGAAYARLARGQRRLGHYEMAMDYLKRAHELFEQVRDERGVAATIDDIGRVHWLRGDYSQALELYRKALAIRRTLGDRRSIALSLANIGRAHHDSGNFKAAIAQFREALDLRRDANDLAGVVQSLCDLGGVHAEDGDHETAIGLLTEAAALAREIGNKPAVADVLSRMGEVKGLMGLGAQAISDLVDAKSLAVGLQDRVVLAVTHVRLAQVYLKSGDLELADVEAHAAVAVSQAAGLRAHIGCGYRVKGEVAAARGREREAEEDFAHAIEILLAVRNEVELARAYQGLAGIRDRAYLDDEAQLLRSRAKDIFARLRGAATID